MAAYRQTTSFQPENAGATVFVAGTSVFGAPDPAEAIRDLRRMIEGETWIQE